MKQEEPLRRMKSNKPLIQDHPRRARAIADCGRRFDDLYGRLDSQLTRMAEIQLEFDDLRSKFRLL